MIVGGDVFSGGKKQMDCSSGKKKQFTTCYIKKILLLYKYAKTMGKET